MPQPLQAPTSYTVSRVLSGLAILAASIAVVLLLSPAPLADVFFAGVVLLGVGFTVIGAIGTWTNRTPLVWVAALLLSGLTILGMLSIGIYLVPAAILLLGAAIVSQLAGPRLDVRDAIIANPPTERDVLRRTLLGVGAVLGGTGLVYIGAFTQELFGACASETVVCVLNATNWGAISLTVLGLLGISIGGWTVWKQTYITRVRSSTRTQP